MAQQLRLDVDAVMDTLSFHGHQFRSKSIRLGQGDIEEWIYNQVPVHQLQVDLEAYQNEFDSSNTKIAEEALECYRGFLIHLQRIHPRSGSAICDKQAIKASRVMLSKAFHNIRELSWKELRFISNLIQCLVEAFIMFLRIVQDGFDEEEANDLQAQISRIDNPLEWIHIYPSKRQARMTPSLILKPQDTTHWQDNPSPTTSSACDSPTYGTGDFASTSIPNSLMMYNLPQRNQLQYYPNTVVPLPDPLFYEVTEYMGTNGAIWYDPQHHGSVKVMKPSKHNNIPGAPPSLEVHNQPYVFYHPRAK